MSALLIASGLGTTAAAFYLFRFVGAAPSWTGTFVKLLGAVCLGLVVLTLAPDPGGLTDDLLTPGALLSPYVVLGGALLACAMGDAFLSRDGWVLFLAGILSFALAQFGFILTMAKLVSGLPFPPELFRFVVIGASALGIVLLPRLIPLGVRVVMMGYACILVTMAWFAVNSGSLLLALGAVLFVLSDLLIAVGMDLRLPKPAQRVAQRLVWITYWMALLLLTWGFFFLL